MSRNRAHGSIPIALLTLFAAAVPGAGQAPTDEMVPLELVQVLSRAPFGRAAPPRVLVGRIPDATADVLPIPEDSRTVGSLVYPGYAMSAVAVPGAPGVVRDEWVERLLDRGWTRYERPSRGGFESNPVEGLRFCMGDSLTVSLSVSRNPEGGSYAHAMLMNRRSTSFCDDRPEPRSSLAGESLIPSLAPPPGSVAMGSGSGRGGDHQEAHARLRSDLTLDELIEHYGAQLREHGWTPRGRSSGPGVATEVFAVTDPEGAAWHGVLVASGPSPDSDRFLYLRLDRLERSY